MDAFAALADPVRRDLLVAVSHGPQRVVDLAADQLITRPAVSRHLRLLNQAGLVDVEDRGRERHYRLRQQTLAQVEQFLDRLRENTLAGPLTAGALEALDTEVHRSKRDRRAAAIPEPVVSDATAASREDIA